MINCKKCGSNRFRECYMCPQVGGEVCAECCRKCTYHSYNIHTGMQCKYPRPDYAGELKKLRRTIADKDRQIAWLYNNNKPNAASRVIAERAALYNQVREIETRLK